MSKHYHVAKNGNDHNEGTADQPLLTINAAAQLALPGDTVTVHEGIYREWVNPKYGGLSEQRRITYEAAEGEHVVIKGSEVIDNWQKVEGTIWKAVVPNSLFGCYNPYAELLLGDWLIYRNGEVHTGDVYLNGKSFYEALSYDELKAPEMRTEVKDHWTKTIVPVLDPDQTRYLWFAEVDDDNTTIYANFHDANPNEELVEINVRRSCFYPESTGLNYITVRGFEMAQAATPWTPPTADQPGLIGPHWAKGWIIENNHIHDAKTSAISIGKEHTTGHNYRTFRKDKPGYQYQLESVFTARKQGWSKETIGSHIIRNNVIHDCGQNGVVGHLGCVFSEIYGNHIYNIAQKREFYGHEIAGIKLHAAIDVQIHHNYFHDCSLGVWMDWQAQGTHISHNIFLNNSRDLYVEVTHGPHLIDHNLFLSDYSLDNHAQGGAYVNNIFNGYMEVAKQLNRATPYHAPHSTDVRGYAMVYCGDDRFIGNIFIGGKGKEVGTSAFNSYTTSLDDYISKVAAQEPGDLNIFENVEQPVYVSNNCYLSGASAFDKEKDNLVLPDFATDLEVEEDEDGVYLICNLPKEFDSFTVKTQGTETLGRVRIVDQEFEAPNGESLSLSTDFLGQDRGFVSVTGPISTLRSGSNRVCIWSFA